MLNRFLYGIVRFSGLPFIIRNTIQKKNITIILFHKIKPETFEKNILILKKLYNIISLQDYLFFRQNKVNSLPAKSLIITIDDGHKSNFELLPIIQKYNIPITIFLCASIVDSHRHFWFEDAISAGMDIRELKTKSNVNLTDELKLIGFEKDKLFKDRQSLSVDEIREMEPYVDFQSHTNYHPILTNCSSELAYSEIKLSKEKLEQLLRKKINALSYPNGNYSKREMDFSIKAGYSLALTLDCGFNDRTTDLMSLNRIALQDNDDKNELISKISGVWCFLKNLKK